MRGNKSLQIAVALLLVILLLAYVVWGAFPNPLITMAELGGLTPEQVIARIGPPPVDPRKPDEQGRIAWTPEREAQGIEGPLTFIYNDYDNRSYFPYRWGGHKYTVVFGNNRVSEVRSYFK